MYARLEYSIQKNTTGVITDFVNDSGVTESSYIPSTQLTTEFKIPSFQDIFDNEKLPDTIHTYDMEYGFEESSFILNVSSSASITLTGTTTKEEIDAQVKGVKYSEKKEVAPDTYTLVYRTTWRNGNADTYCYVKLTYTTSATYYKLPLKKWTITDCVNRCLELVEPLRVTSSTGTTMNQSTSYTNKLNISAIETPRFIFDGVTYDKNGVRQSTYTAGSQAEKYDKVIAPEFAMTKSNLREQLQQIGGFIHAEPRLVMKDGKYIVVFDEYGKREYSSISKKPYITKTLKQSVNDFCTELDSTVDNLVNRLAYAKGVMVEPYIDDNGKSLRAESVAMRINDENGYIPTQLPIDNKYKLEINAPISSAATSWTGWVDITDYLFEKADYDNMSSIKGTYPYAKAFALYYTQGEKGVRGLFFKNPDAVSQAWFQKYAIINILGACGQSIDTNSYPYASIRFRITYVPRYSARVKTSKQLVIPGLPSTLAYSQGANLVETRYYGENLKGVVARLGNVEKSLTYKVGYLSDIPKAGQLFDKNYYISAVEWEVYSSYYKVTIGLSKDFNRLSEYVGISSVNRMYQVSEKQAQARDSVFHEYILITYDKNAKSDASTFGQELLMRSVSSLFNSKRATTVNLVPRFCVVWGLTKKGEQVQSFYVTLPVCVSAMGNSFSFSVKFNDNYSAGQKASEMTIDSVKSMWGEYVPYNDYYGRFYWLNFAFMPNPVSSDETTEYNLPQRNNFVTSVYDTKNAVASTIYAENSGTKELPILYRKESTEIPSITYEASFVTDDDKTIIGSGLARNLSIITNSYMQEPKLYIFDDELPVFEDKVDTTGLTDIAYHATFTKTNNGVVYLNHVKVTANKSGKAWAIVTNSVQSKSTVEDEDGNAVIQTEERGCDILLGRNIEITEGQTIELPQLVLKRKLY